MTLWIAAFAAAVVVAAVLAALLAGRHRHAAGLQERLRELEASTERTVKDSVTQRLRQEEARLTKDIDSRRTELARREEELSRGQAELAESRLKSEEQAAALDAKAEVLAERAGQFDTRARELEQKTAALEQAESAVRARLEEVAGLTTDQARQRLMDEAEREVQADVARMVQRADEAARRESEDKAREATLRALSTLRGSVVAEGTITVVTLPSDEMKGRVIGREGRNIRALELATGVDLLVDDTPRAILLSSWDPLRRAVASRSLAKLVEDGRIHPARIEEVVDKTRQEVDEESRERGERVCFDLGLAGVHDRLILLLGRLDFMRDHGQNLLQRGREVAQLSGAIADELRVASDTLRRAGLLHEVARADQTPLLTHWAIASADLATRFGEKPAVAATIRALASPPDAPRTPEGVILNTARRLSLSRPGARNENLQRFMDRQQEIEALALARDGVEIAVAVRAGRELRVHLRADAVPDDGAHLMARELARAIEKRVDYPGQVRVTVIRETRAVSFAV